jgi:hypothetical protein
MSSRTDIETFLANSGFVKRDYTSQLTDKEYSISSKRDQGKKTVIKLKRHSYLFDEQGNFLGFEYAPEMTMRLTNKDPDGNQRHSVNLRVVGKRNDWLQIFPEGYGEPLAIKGQGSPVLLEVYNGELRVVVFQDILEQEPTILSLEKAREDRLADSEE